MGALIPNMTKGSFAWLATLPAANDAIVAVAFTGTETDAALRDVDHLTAAIATALNEATFTGYSRQTLTGITRTIDDTNDRVDVDSVDPAWSPTTSEVLSRIGYFYDPDTTAGTDADLLPIFFDDFAVTTPTSGTVTYLNAAGAFGRAS